ncbi:DUF4062 domain-containing protein [Brevibacillus brevis]|uniref:DUF4062 domain-containing protein n=1 Tax=Brevibacillus brevis TaxID=1393 RepID=UPI001A91E976
MKKKLQVFISSTFIDLKEERQAAVEAILNAGHIPAGMELFNADSASQLEVIKHWIDESDVYMLILGGRYGSIEQESGKSYTHIEYDYAIEQGKPVFSVVISKEALDKKIGILKTDALETMHGEKYEGFKKLVTSKVCRFFDDVKDIKLSIHETLNKFREQYELAGWVSGKEIQDTGTLVQQIAQLQ